MKHPMQPIELAADGMHRFKKNAIVSHLLDNGPHDMNSLLMRDFSDEDLAQFMQLIGYSVFGFDSLSNGLSDSAREEARVAYAAFLDAEKLTSAMNSFVDPARPNSEYSYAVLRDDDVQSLIKEVSTYLNDGWSHCGGVSTMFVGYVPEGRTTAGERIAQYSQAMIKKHIGE